MNADLVHETEKLARSWEQHEAAWLRDYLVAGVEDPRLNLQSIISRHFLLNALLPGRWAGLMRHEYRFAATMEWLLRGSDLINDAEVRSATVHALRRGADNAEGLEIPAFIVRAFASLPTEADGCTIPNYLEAFLTQPASESDALRQSQTALDTFALAWRSVLERDWPQVGTDQQTRERNTQESEGPSDLPALLEPACGSANDYRFLDRYGMGRLFRYTGFDLCQKNIDNARRLFPTVCFRQGNVFEIQADSKSFDFCIVHDLFEHFSPAGLEQAVREICRVTRQEMCLGFFQMDEIPEHIVRPREEYHWTLLSLARMKGLFARHGFGTQAIHLGTFLAHHTGCQHTHNPNAYALVLRASTTNRDTPFR